MVKSKIVKDLTKMLKKTKKLGLKAMKSTITLYVVLFMALINLFNFVNNKDNESLFLFIVVSAIVYMKTTNMILVLLIPLIFVNLLIYLRKMFISGREGFNMKVEEFNDWFDSNVSNLETPSESEDPEGFKFYEKRIKPILEIEDKDEPTVGDMEITMSLYKSLSEMLIKKNESDSKYINKIVQLFKENFSTDDTEENETDEEDEEDEELKIKKDNKKKEPFSFLENFEDEDEEEDEEDYEDEDEDYDEDYEDDYED